MCAVTYLSLSYMYITLFCIYFNAGITTPGSLPSLNLTQGVPNDVTITLPEDSVTLTTGFFDHGSVEALQYRWSRSDSSPAIGVSVVTLRG